MRTFDTTAEPQILWPLRSHDWSSGISQGIRGDPLCPPRLIGTALQFTTMDTSVGRVLTVLLKIDGWRMACNGNEVARASVATYLSHSLRTQWSCRCTTTHLDAFASRIRAPSLLSRFDKRYCNMHPSTLRERHHTRLACCSSDRKAAPNDLRGVPAKAVAKFFDRFPTCGRSAHIYRCPLFQRMFRTMPYATRRGACGLRPAGMHSVTGPCRRRGNLAAAQPTPAPTFRLPAWPQDDNAPGTPTAATRCQHRPSTRSFRGARPPPERRLWRNCGGLGFSRRRFRKACARG